MYKKVANSVCGQPSREEKKSLSSFAPENLVSRYRFGRLPRVSRLILLTEAESGAYSRKVLSFFTLSATASNYTINHLWVSSSLFIIYRVAQFANRWCVPPKARWQKASRLYIVLNVARITGVLPIQVSNPVDTCAPFFPHPRVATVKIYSSRHRVSQAQSGINCGLGLVCTILICNSCRGY